MLCHIRYALIVGSVVVFIILLSKWTGTTRVAPPPPSPPPPPPLTQQQQQPQPQLSQVRAVVAEAANANLAAHDHPNSMDALLSVTHALATLNAAETLAGQDAVSNAAGVPVHTLQKELREHQQQLVRTITKK